MSLSVFSGKGGVGKSSLCANLGFCLGEMGHSCLLMDCDLGLANLDVLRQQPLVRLAGQSPAARDIRIVAQRIQSLRNALLPEIACAPAIKIFNAHPMKISR